MRRGRRRNYGLYFFLFIILLIASSGVYLYNSQMFERINPKIELKKEIYWNLKTPIPIKISDSSGIKFIRIVLRDEQNDMVLLKEVYDQPKTEVNLQVKFPQSQFFGQKDSYELVVEAVDFSSWNFFSGNKSVYVSNLKIDNKKPRVNALINSYQIITGGVGAVVFQARDENLDKVYIKTSSGHQFKPTPFYKDGYYISLVAWPSNEKSFRAEIVAVDKANNESKERIKFYLTKKNYRHSNIKLNDNFLNGEITDLADKFLPVNSNLNKLERFKFVNETLREKNEELIAKVTSKVPTQMIDDFKLAPFYPLRNGAAVASFGDYRTYFYNDEKISESYHLGLDLASTANATIKASNDGVVVFADDNGIYGQNLIIDHGLGLYSLYGHCSSFAVAKGDLISADDDIASTGMSGLALGDHLHFGIIVQGVEVRPEEWMDKSWMRDNVFNIIRDAKKIIDRKK